MLTQTATLVRLESLAAAALAVVLYSEVGVSWWLLAILFLAPDLPMIGYLAGPRVGAMTYNAAHVLVGPSILALIGVLGDRDTWTAVSLIWFAHIAIDRTFGYGLKEPTDFRDTHLSTPGKGRSLSPDPRPLSPDY
jgi:hypothetical protein